MLYNITFNLNDTRTHLVPYIPYTASDDEDRVTERICFSDSVEHCISAIGSCSRDLYRGCQIVIRSVDERSLNPSLLITPQMLYDTMCVPDALENMEYWYLDEVDVKREIYLIDDFDFTFSIAFTCIKREDMNRIINKYYSYDFLNTNESIEQVFNRIKFYFERDNDDERFEEFCDDLCELPWSRKINISNLIMIKLQ